MTVHDYDVFIFHLREDQSDAEELARNLKNAGIKVFYDPWPLVLGRRRDRTNLEQALRKSRTGIALLGRQTVDPEYRALLDQAATQLELLIPVYVTMFSHKIQASYPALEGRPGVFLESSRALDQLVAAIMDAPLEEVVAARKMRSLEPFSEPSYLKRIELESIRGFDTLVVRLDASPIRQGVVVGRNGTCKTTLLRCVVLALAGSKDAPSLLSSRIGRWITNGQSEGVIRLSLETAEGEQTSRELKIVEDSGGELIHMEEPDDMIFACAYGTGRSDLGSPFGRSYRVIDSAATLFDYSERLVASELVLRRLFDFLGSKRFEAVLSSLKRALGLSREHVIELTPGGGVEISGPGLGGRIPLEAWADGYRMTFSWLIDFYGWAMRAGAFDEAGEICGILLVDELEQHLHPAMQREILGHLRTALPKVQIIATTHSPLIALSARPEQIIALHRDGELVKSVPVPSLDGYSADDVLVEEALFGTSPYPPATEVQLNRYQELARIPPERRSPEEVDELGELARRLDPSSLPALRDDPVLNKLDLIASRLGAAEADE